MKNTKIKYAVIDERTTNGFTDIYVDEYSTKEDAIKSAEDEWGRMCNNDKKHHVVLVVEYDANSNPIEDGYNRIVWNSEEEE